MTKIANKMAIDGKGYFGSSRLWHGTSKTKRHEMSYVFSFTSQDFFNCENLPGECVVVFNRIRAA
jgi:hypothetical protein